MSEQVSLAYMAAGSFQQAFLCVGFDAFHQYPHVEAAAHLDDLLQYGQAALAVFSGEQHTAVNLHDIHGQVPQHGNGGVARAEVIHGQGKTHALETPGNLICSPLGRQIK